METLLKERRAGLGIEIDAIAEITRIKSSYLKAIEEEDFSKLPIEVYSKGYIREYAKFIGVPSEGIISRYDDYLEEKKGNKNKGRAKELAAGIISTPVQIKKDQTNKSALPEITASKTANADLISKNVNMTTGALDTKEVSVVPDTSDPVRTNSPVRSLLWILPLLLIVIFAYYWSHKEDKATVVIVKPVQIPKLPANDVSPDKTDQKDVPAAPPPSPEIPVKTNPITKNIENPVLKKHSLEITATERVWVQLLIDGSDKKKKMMNPGEMITYTADKSFDLLAGNAGGVKIKYDGKEYTNLGDKGQIIQFNLPAMTAPRIIPARKKNPEPATSGNSTTQDIKPIDQ